jgi:hypothetical protein
MTTDKALDLALEALEGVVKNCWRDIPSWRLDEIKERITAINQARSAPVQEPVAWRARYHYGTDGMAKRIGAWRLHGFSPTPEEDKEIEPLYTTPPAAQRQWVGLTMEDIKIEIDESGLESHEYGQETIQLIYAIEAKLREKNA